jgi:two-component system, OmpR family, response regulator VicR
MKVLVIEDSPAIIETISIAIEVRWPDAKILSTPLGLKGIQITDKESPDVIILDLGLPDINGMEVLKRIRAFSKIPVLILTANADEANIVGGLEWGADDYIIKPFHQLILVSRINGVLRRYHPEHSRILSCGNLRFDPVTMTLTSGFNQINISRAEGIIIGQLMVNAGITVTTSSIADALWGNENHETSQSIKVHIHNLREKLEQDPNHPQIILTKRRSGYLLVKNTN